MPAIMIDEKERARVREALKVYQHLHGDITDKELHERMMNLLGLDRSQFSRPTLRRFLRGIGRTEDFTVRRYQKFLDLVAPLTYADDLGTAFEKAIPRPFRSFSGDKRRDAAAIAGSYVFSIRDPDGNDPGGPDVITRMLVLTPARAPHNMITVHRYLRKPREGEGEKPVVEYAETGAFVPCGMNFLLSAFGLNGTSFALLSLVSVDPVTFSGTMIHAGATKPIEQDVYTLHLKKFDPKKFPVELPVNNS